jgi:hypothetical protein
MSKVIPIMGFERGAIARSLNNRDRQQRINSLTHRTIYDNPVARKPKVNPESYNTIAVAMSEKLRVRRKRQDLMSRQGPATVRTIEREANPLLIENVEERMAKTNMEFYSTGSTFYQRGGTALKQTRGSLSKELSAREPRTSRE